MKVDNTGNGEKMRRMQNMQDTDKGKRSFVKLLYIMLSIVVAFLILYGLYLILKGTEPKTVSSDALSSMVTDNIDVEVTTEPFMEDIEYPSVPDDAKVFDKTIASKFCVLLDLQSNKVIAQRDAEKRMYPASMTKVMTLIVAVENMQSLSDTFVMTEDIIAPLVDENASMAGFQPGEEITMEDLLYGAILPSGADATAGIAMKISGSEEGFVELMNEKAKQLGLHDTHFMNTSGLQDEDHYMTALDMAVILNYAINNDICRKVLSTYQYTTSKTKEHPDGIPLESTLFSRMYGDEVEGVIIEGGKTGYTDEAQHTMASFAKKGDNEYIAVVAHEDDKWGSVYDTFDIYEKYLD